MVAKWRRRCAVMCAVRVWVTGQEAPHEAWRSRRHPCSLFRWLSFFCSCFSHCPSFILRRVSEGCVPGDLTARSDLPSPFSSLSSQTNTSSDPLFTEIRLTCFLFLRCIFFVLVLCPISHGDRLMFCCRASVACCLPHAARRAPSPPDVLVSGLTPYRRA